MSNFQFYYTQNQESLKDLKSRMKNCNLCAKLLLIIIFLSINSFSQSDIKKREMTIKNVYKKNSFQFDPLKFLNEK